MEESIEVRRMAASDVSVVASIYAEILDATYISFSELSEGKATQPDLLTDRASIIFQAQLVSNISQEGQGFFVALIGGDIVGFVLASLRQAVEEHSECWIDDLGIRRAWRRQGVGTTLLKRAVEWGTNEGARYFLVESGAQNSSTHDLLKKMRFQPLAIVFWRAAFER